MHLQTTPIQRFDFFALTDFAAPDEAFEEITPVALVEEEAEETPPPSPPPPSFNEAELEAAKAAAYAEGLEAGKAEQAESDQAEAIAATKSLATAAQSISAQMNDAHSVMDAHIAEQQQALLQCARAMAEQLAGAALQENADALLRDMVNHCLPHLLCEPAVQLTAAPESCERLDSIMQEAITQTGFAGEYSITENADAAAGDITMSWRNGEASRSLAALKADLDKIVPAIPDEIPQQAKIADLSDIESITSLAPDAKTLPNTDIQGE